MNRQVLIPRRGVGFVEAKPFSNYRLSFALRECYEQGYVPLTMPYLLAAKSQATFDDIINQEAFSTGTLRAIGLTPQGNQVVLYAHVPNYLWDPQSYERLNKSERKLHTALIPEKEFYRLLKLEGGTRVIVKDFSEIINAKRSFMTLDEILNHPEMAPLAGSQRRAEDYVQFLSEHFENDIEFLAITFFTHVPGIPCGHLINMDGFRNQEVEKNGRVNVKNEIKMIISGNFQLRNSIMYGLTRPVRAPRKRVY